MSDYSPVNLRKSFLNSPEHSTQINASIESDSDFEVIPGTPSFNDASPFFSANKKFDFEPQATGTNQDSIGDVTAGSLQMTKIKELEVEEAAEVERINSGCWLGGDNLSTNKLSMLLSDMQGRLKVDDPNEDTATQAELLATSSTAFNPEPTTSTTSSSVSTTRSSGGKIVRPEGTTAATTTNRSRTPNRTAPVGNRAKSNSVASTRSQSSVTSTPSTTTATNSNRTTTPNRAASTLRSSRINTPASTTTTTTAPKRPTTPTATSTTNNRSRPTTPNSNSALRSSTSKLPTSRPITPTSTASVRKSTNSLSTSSRTTPNSTGRPTTPNTTVRSISSTPAAAKTRSTTPTPASSVRSVSAVRGNNSTTSSRPTTPTPRATTPTSSNGNNVIKRTTSRSTTPTILTTTTSRPTTPNRTSSSLTRPTTASLASAAAAPSRTSVSPTRSTPKPTPNTTFTGIRATTTPGTATSHPSRSRSTTPTSGNVNTNTRSTSASRSPSRTGVRSSLMVNTAASAAKGVVSQDRSPCSSVSSITAGPSPKISHSSASFSYRTPNRSTSPHYNTATSRNTLTKPKVAQSVDLDTIHRSANSSVSGSAVATKIAFGKCVPIDSNERRSSVCSSASGVVRKTADEQRAIKDRYTFSNTKSIPTNTKSSKITSTTTTNNTTTRSRNVVPVSTYRNTAVKTTSRSATPTTVTSNNSRGTIRTSPSTSATANHNSKSPTALKSGIPVRASSRQSISQLLDSKSLEGIHSGMSVDNSTSNHFPAVSPILSTHKFASSYYAQQANRSINNTTSDASDLLTPPEQSTSLDPALQETASLLDIPQSDFDTKPISTDSADHIDRSSVMHSPKQAIQRIVSASGGSAVWGDAFEDTTASSKMALPANETTTNPAANASSIHSEDTADTDHPTITVDNNSHKNSFDDLSDSEISNVVEDEAEKQVLRGIEQFNMDDWSKTMSVYSPNKASGTAVYMPALIESPPATIAKLYDSIEFTVGSGLGGVGQSHSLSAHHSMGLLPSYARKIGASVYQTVEHVASPAATPTTTTAHRNGDGVLSRVVITPVSPEQRMHDDVAAIVTTSNTPHRSNSIAIAGDISSRQLKGSAPGSSGSGGKSIFKAMSMMDFETTSPVKSPNAKSPALLNTNLNAGAIPSPSVHSERAMMHALEQLKTLSGVSTDSTNTKVNGTNTHASALHKKEIPSTNREQPLAIVTTDEADATAGNSNNNISTNTSPVHAPEQLSPTQLAFKMMDSPRASLTNGSMKHLRRTISTAAVVQHSPINSFSHSPTNHANAYAATISPSSSNHKQFAMNDFTSSPRTIELKKTMSSSQSPLLAGVNPMSSNNINNSNNTSSKNNNNDEDPNLVPLSHGSDMSEHFHTNNAAGAVLGGVYPLRHQSFSAPLNPLK